MLIPRSGHTAIYEPSKKQIFVFGGYTGTEVLNDICIFDAEENSWQNLSMSEEEIALGPRARTSHAACIDEENYDKFYIFGGSGKNIGFENYNDLWYFDFITLNFTAILVGKDSAFRPPGMYGHSLNYI
jgi:N-acetylneuraminic acid mutarotase